MTGVVRPSGRPIPLLEPGSPEWLRRMSASKIAAVVGLSPYQSRYSLWMQMAGLTPQTEQTAAVSRGHYLEPAIAAWWADQHPEYRVEPTGTWVHCDHEWMVASPDRLGVGEDGHTVAVQCKSAADGSEWGEAGTDDFPVGYRAQVLWELAVTGLSTCYVAVILPFLEFREYVVEYDAAECDYLMDQGRRFLDSLAAGVRPELDAHRATYEAVRQSHPGIADEKVDVPDDLAAAYLAAVAACRAAEAAKRLASARLADYMGSAQAAFYGGQCIARRQVKGSGTPYLVTARGAGLSSVGSAA